MNYTNREVVRRLKQYDMFLSSLELTKDEVQRERIRDTLSMLQAGELICMIGPGKRMRMRVGWTLRLSSALIKLRDRRKWSRKLRRPVHLLHLQISLFCRPSL